MQKRILYKDIKFRIYGNGIHTLSPGWPQKNPTEHRNQRHHSQIPDSYRWVRLGPLNNNWGQQDSRLMESKHHLHPYWKPERWSGAAVDFPIVTAGPGRLTPHRKKARLSHSGPFLVKDRLYLVPRRGEGLDFHPIRGKHRKMSGRRGTRQAQLLPSLKSTNQVMSFLREKPVMCVWGGGWRMEGLREQLSSDKPQGSGK